MRKSVLLLLLAAIIANAAYFLLKSDWSEHEDLSPAPPPAATAPVVAPPPLETLGQGARMPTTEELAEEARYDEKQVELAGTWLNSPSPEKRVSGAEQLSAFPTPEAEQILIKTLTLEFDPVVRRTAAQSLGAFRQPTDKAVDALLAALQDDSEEVQASALDTLTGMAGRMENGSERLKKLFADLRRTSASRQVKPLTRKSILAFLKDQAPPSHPFGGR